MLFSEVYGRYYNTVAAILSEAVADKLYETRLNDIVKDKAFEESLLWIPVALRNGSWPLLNSCYDTPLHKAPKMPLTILEKRWMKALLSDQRIKLFDPPLQGLENVEPLFEPDIFVYYDRYNDGDPYGDEEYITRFRTILASFREKRKLKIWFRSHRDVEHKWECVPYKLVYSPKDDKFRLITRSSRGNMLTVNLARIKRCVLLDSFDGDERIPLIPEKEKLVIEIIDERNALERAMLHFSHLEREAERISEDKYRVTLYYDKEDMTEILIRVLSFGHKVQVIAPAGFIDLIRERIERQKSLIKT